MIMVDLNNLPSRDLATLYRVALCSRYGARGRFDQALGQMVADVHRGLHQEAAQDSFTTSAHRNASSIRKMGVRAGRSWM